MQPMNYTIQTGDAGDAFTQGMNRTAGMMATVADYQKSQAIATAAQQKAEADAYKRQRFMQVAQNPTPDLVNKLSLEFPEIQEAAAKSIEYMSSTERRNTHAVASSVLSAIDSDNQDAAIYILDQQAKAAENSKNQEAYQKYQTLKDAVIANPTGAKFGLMTLLRGTMDPKDWASYSSTLGKEARDEALQPALVEKGKAEASETASKAVTAAAKAKFSESEAAIDLQKKGWDITKIQEDIKINKMNSQIAAMNAQTSRMSAGTAAQGNSLKAQENQIKLADLIDKRNTAVRDKAAEVEAARFNIDNMLNTADRVLKTPKSVISSAAGPISSRIPTMSSDTADFEALVGTLGSQAFLSQLPNIKGMGQLSNTEGDKLQAALQNMSLKQSPERLVENVKEAQRLLLKVRKNVAERSGMPDTVPDTPAAAPSGANIDALLKKYGQ